MICHSTVFKTDNQQGPTVKKKMLIKTNVLVIRNKNKRTGDKVEMKND